MGSLEAGVPIKKDPYPYPYPYQVLRSSSRPRPRSKFSRFLLFKRLDYLQWICTIGVFLLFVVFFQMFLPGSVMDKSEVNKRDHKDDSDFMFLREIGGLDFGGGIRFEASKVLEKFRRESRRKVNLTTTSSSTGLNVALRRFGYRKPQLALVFGDLLADPQQLLMVTVGAALREIGYELQVYSLKDGPVHSVWTNLGAQVSIIGSNDDIVAAVDWLNFNGIIINSLGAESVFSCFLQEPFKSLPLLWTMHDAALAVRLRDYNSSGHIELLNGWKKFFNRASAVVFPNYALPMAFSAFDKGNFIVIPGSPAEPWEADAMITLQNDNLQNQIGLGPDDVVITIVGSHFMYKGLWLENALVLRALLPLLADFQSDKGSGYFLRIIVLSGNSVSNYSVVVEAIAHNLGYPVGIVENKAVEDADGILSTANLVIYGSFLEEHSFPELLLKAMCMGKPVVAPKLSMITKYVDDRASGYLFPKDNLNVLAEIVRHVFSRGKLSPLARNIASMGKSTARNLMAAEAVDGYATLLEIVLKLPSEVAPPKAVTEISPQSKQAWKWDLFEAVPKPAPFNRTSRSYNSIDKVEEKWDRTQREAFTNPTASDDSFSYNIWEEEKNFQAVRNRKKREDDELKDRTDQTHGTWEDVYKSAKRADRSRNDLHERDDKELERTGQPLCIYEPFLGEGTWPFLHTVSLYRGIGLSSKGRRPGGDDIDAPSRLPLLNNPYYRDVLGDYGAYFAIANRIDRVHKNSWIGFQSWRATARKASLSKIAERALVDSIEKRRHGDALYFWVRMDMDPRNPLQRDFWSFCDSINAGNCRFAFSEALKKVYGLKGDSDALPSMPLDGGTWSVMQSWALPTRSFLEFVMFSRMFVDALDAQMYDEHHSSGYCYLSLSKDKHCYSRVLELLINVWAYHSARRIVYVNAETGVMQEQHKLQDRRRKMWIKWFNFATLKSMDEEYAEEYDSEHPKRRWLWPSTGEVFCQSVLERERNQRHKQKEKRKRDSRAKLDRMKHRARQRVIGKFIKPLPEEEVHNSNSTIVANSTAIL